MKVVLIFFLAFFGGFLAFWMRGLGGILSYEAGFASFVCVFLSLYLSIKPKISNLSQKEDENIEDENISFVQKMSVGLGLSFSIFRIIAYVGLVGILMALIKWGFFDVYVYMVGIFLGLCGAFFWILLEWFI